MPEQEWQYCKCGASWLGYAFERCDWCYARKQAHWESEKAELLNPSWMHNQGPKYHELTEVQRMVWDTTRGIKRGAGLTQDWLHMTLTDVERDWLNDLHECQEIGLITEHEMVRAIAKWNSMKNSSGGTRPDKNP